MPRAKQFDEKEVLNKAMELFWEKGFHATSMQDLVSKLGINRASLYDTYGSKEALFEKALELYRITNGKIIKQLFEAENSVKKGFKKLFDKAIQEALQDKYRRGCFVVNTTTELIPGDIKLQGQLMQNKQITEALFIDFVQKGIANGELDSNLDASAVGLMLFTLFNGIRVLAKVEPDQDKLEKTIESGLSVLK